MRFGGGLHDFPGIAGFFGSEENDQWKYEDEKNPDQVEGIQIGKVIGLPVYPHVQ